MKENLYDRIGELLKTKEEYRSEDGDLLKAKVYSDIMTMDKNLLSLLLSDEEVKKAFFLKVDDALVFDKQKFAWIIDSKEFLPDSYTSYTNKIGLTSDGDFISKRKDVVLDFPYKDCVLEGGQTKDNQNRKEIFYNETLAQDEIRRMLDPKVFTKAKRYTKEGVEEGITFNEDDNLIIKGNNLIALASLLKRYEGQVKCIYIDSPYNTGSDSFNYNDNFNHSSWLTFMKNRLEIAKKLLTNDGVIFVQCDDNEQAYLKVLMDDIFDRENFVNCICVKMSETSGLKMSHIRYRLPKLKEYVLLYKKGPISLNPIRISKTDKGNLKKYAGYYSNIIENINDEVENWKITPLNDYLTRNSLDLNDEEVLQYKIDNAERMVYRTNNKSFEGLDISKKIAEITSPKGLKYIWWEGKQMLFLKDYLEESIGDLWTDLSTINLNKEGGVDLKNAKKPESLIKRIIELLTNRNDIVLDFFLGSGTTAATAHKMGRRYIGVEQMDYIEDITVERLRKVIEGDQGGISKAVDWQGGGSFVYCELMENGNELIRQIENSDKNTIKDVKAKIYRDDRIIPYITTEELEQADKDFEELNLEEKNKALIKIVDKNKLYVNYSDIDSGDFDISDADKKFTKSFYEVD